MIDEIVKAKPAAAKGRYLISVTLTSTMGPGVKLDTTRQTAGDILATAGLEAPEAEAAETNGHSSTAEEISAETDQELETISAADSPFEVEDPDA